MYKLESKIKEKQQTQDLTEKEIAVRNYILENPEVNHNQVVKEMNNLGVCSRITTLKIIQDLISRGRLEDRKEKANGFSRLFVTDINEFNKISNELSEIKHLMDAMEEPIQDILQLKIKSNLTDKQLMKKLQKIPIDSHHEPINDPYSDLYHHLIFPYEEATTLMLQHLLLEINNKIMSKKDSELLFAKTTKLMIRLSKQIFDVRKNEYLDFSIKEFGHIRSNTLKFAQKNLINLDIREDIVQTITGFEEKFLSDKTNIGVKSR